MRTIDQRIADHYFRIAFLSGMQYGRDNPAEPLSLSPEDEAALEGALAEQRAIDYPKETT